ncbi:nucleotidyltransferase domain-containing protein [Pyrobaculum neutrophilum]|uniref:DNA polymerase beta domain protein region n=1 Tax=Pyrobaculum neutrophilum (strain DSM 2338 / JCM 9278 / NBRC 100436 / V24Sta) TaxID=444157 RepID=B1YCD6_PYRNV|nr:nucleotidyltransferase domain-containing protein [Pyrobaculum neutrophilum]ACB39449.1 DNA polymerase beta domain protein region [Pyrobaculum neutrophilum V24Sta]
MRLEEPRRPPWLEAAMRRRKYLENWRTYAAEICREARRHLGDARVVVFGSVVRGDWTPDSDIDILIISEKAPQDPTERAKINTALREAIGDYAAPFEFHYATPRQYAEWYSRFIDAKAEIC